LGVEAAVDMVSRIRGVHAHFMVITDADAVNRGRTQSPTSLPDGLQHSQPHGVTEAVAARIDIFLND